MASRKKSISPARECSAVEKAHAAIEALESSRSIEAIAAGLGVEVDAVLRWRQQLIEHAAVLFDDDGAVAAISNLNQEQKQVNEALLKKVLQHMAAEENLVQSESALHRLLAHQERMREDEHKRIAREVHDELGQNLLAIRIDISMLHSRTQRAHPLLHQRAAAVLKNIDATMASVRSIISELRPFELELGLQAAMQWQLKRFQREHGVACSLLVETNAEAASSALKDEQILAMFRVLQEWLAYAVLPASAGRVDAALGFHDGKLTMVVVDNGVIGKARAGGDSVAVAAMRERLCAQGGTLSIEPRRGATRLLISIPVPA
jgi:signal transduction histidine kinase